MSKKRPDKVITTDDNKIMVWCTLAEKYKPAEEFYHWKSSTNGYSPSCVNCSYLKRTGQGGIKEDRDDQYALQSKMERQAANEILIKLGYDIDSDIPVYQQFEKRMKEKL